MRGLGLVSSLETDFLPLSSFVRVLYYYYMSPLYLAAPSRHPVGNDIGEARTSIYMYVCMYVCIYMDKETYKETDKRN